MYQTIVVPIDPRGFAEPALLPAIELARAFQAQIVLVGSPAVVEHHRVDIEQRAGQAVGHSYVFQGREPAEMIADVASRNADPLVVMATHARGRLGYALGGSTAEDVLRARSCPVMLIGPGHNPTWRPGTNRVVVALDGSDLSEQSLPTACSWAAHFHVPLTLLHVHQPPPAPGSPVGPIGGYIGGEFPGSPAFDPSAVSQPDPGHHTPAGETYISGHGNLLRNKGYDVDWEAPTGRHVASTISDYLNENPPNLVVVTTHGRAGLGRVIIGSTTMAITHNAACLVLANAPDTDFTPH